MRPVTLSAFALLLALVPMNASAQPAVPDTFDGNFVCDRDILRTDVLQIIAPEALKLREFSAARRATTIQLNAGLGLAANPQALATWSDAVALWETILTDNVTVKIDGDLVALPSGVLGSTSSQIFAGAGYDAIRDAVVADRAGDEGIVTSLPTSIQVTFDLPNTPAGFVYDNDVRASRALLSALGFDTEGFDPGGIDATIEFSTGFLSSFDFDPTDGITAGKIDFFAVVVHEIGHALGFSSNVDLYDFYVDQNTPISSGPMVLDLFRLVPGAGAANFTTATRILTHGGEVAAQTFYDGVVERRFSTGFYNGDGRQASHWRADELAGGVTIGIMDPTISSGAMGKLTNSDIRAFGIMGWDVTYLADCNGNDIGDQFDIWDGVSQDFNLNGVPDECEATAAPSFVKARVSIAPNPFNPRTEIRLTLPEDARASVNIYDLAGRHVESLVDRNFGAGDHSVIWEGKDSTGRPVSSGVYFVIVDVGGEVQRHKVALVR